MGTKEVWMEAIGIMPQWHKQGLASALMMMAMTQYKAIGMETAVLDVDTQNTTGALRLYQNLEFSTVKYKISFAKEVRVVRS